MANENMNYGSEGLRLTKLSEGFSAVAYPDPKSGGDPWTIAYGHTRNVKPGDTCTPTQGEQMLFDDIAECAAILRQYLTVTLNQGQWDAVLDFLFNEGPGAVGIKDGLIWLASGRHSTSTSPPLILESAFTNRPM